MKLRTVNRIVANATGHGDKTLLEHANAFGYLLPNGGTPWDAETMTVRLLGLGKGALDVLAGFDPEATFETPAGPASRLPFTVAWLWPRLPSEPGARVTFATITTTSGRAGTIEVVCTEAYEWVIVAAGNPQRFAYKDILKLEDAAQSAGMILGNELCRETS